MFEEQHILKDETGTKEIGVFKFHKEEREWRFEVKLEAWFNIKDSLEITKKMVELTARTHKEEGRLSVFDGKFNKEKKEASKLTEQARELVED